MSLLLGIETSCDETAAADDDFATIYGQWKEFRAGITQWHGLAETAMVSWTGRRT